MRPPSSWRFSDQVAIVTGGSSGIGRATCLALARVGASVVVVGKTSARVAQTVTDLERLGSECKVSGLVLDVRVEKDMNEMVHRTLERFGRVDIMVASAGIGRGTSSGRLLPYSVATMPTQEWHEVLDTNLKGVFLSNRAVLRTMIKQRKGSIINVSSARGGRFGSPYASAYCASKFGVVGLSESLAEEVRPFGIKVHVLLPDATHTPILGEGAAAQRFGRSMPPERIADLILHILLQPEDTVMVKPLIMPSDNLSWPIGFKAAGHFDV